ncbi:MAG TPA: peptide-methionine (R)-S-oxide reductase MsrB [Thermoanaerobaculia bacterium]|jgi:peptide-methionine (R)-S-oxide reductase|nr:peptide-methionine (R)-S-oxide reductase MsrB [Thermoanaerobaculia bacterium]
MKFAVTLIALALFGALALAAAVAPAPKAEKKGSTQVIEKVVKTEDEWKKVLTPEQFNVLRKEGTERAFTSPLNDNHQKGVFVCAACGLALYSSDQKFESGTGWPSFWAPIDPTHITTKTDRSFFQSRTEVRCARCGGHLGHVFEDGPKPTGLRYCMNGVALKFVPAK